MTKLGAILGAGIVDAGGRNTTISLVSPSGHKKMAAIVGMAVFTQFWYWYPLVHFISLALTPTAVIGLNRDLQVPEGFNFVSNARPALFAYPPPVELKKAEATKTVKHATLSVTAKALAKARKKEGGAADATAAAAGGATPMDVDEEKKSEEKSAEEKEKEKKAAEEKEKKAADDKRTSETLSNPARVTAAQFKLLAPVAGQRYRPVKEILAGCVMLADSTPEQPTVLVASKRVSAALPGEALDEPEPPAPFEYLGN